MNPTHKNTHKNTQQNIQQSNVKIEHPYEIRISKQILNMMNNEELGYIEIVDGDWDRFEMMQICAHVQEWNIRRGLVLRNNRQLSIATQICDIKFTNLMDLDIAQNRIESIECIDRIWLFNLFKLNLSGNNIREIRKLSSSKTPKLTALNLEGNKIVQLISLALINSDSLSKLKISQNGVHGIQWIFKLHSRFVDYLSMDAVEVDLKARSMGAKKYGKLNIFY